MLVLPPTPGLLDAELAYRRERLGADIATSRRLAAWVGRLRRRTTTRHEDLVLAA
ncbi:hypothetical protein [Aquipuribacter hungaricus]|uniref:Uncharacterized protein n=1 Tax=Aquipuribacter hungaricus TaxID=545624 RepID=A0ABV7WNK4_9MICO